MCLDRNFLRYGVMMENETWVKFAESCSCCTKCSLSLSRTQVVLGRGVPGQVPVMLIGEGPGEQEDKEGLAFVGRSGKLLDTLLAALRFAPEEWYIANIVKCRPPDNREPSEEEVAACLPWLRWQVKALRPSIIVCLGRTASKNLIDKDIKLTQARGKWVERQGFYMMPTWHPAAVLRDPSKKTDLFLDMEAVKNKIEMLCRQ